MSSQSPGGFSDVDRQQDPAFYIRMLERQDAQPGIEAARAAAMRMLSPAPGRTLLDVGCGIGTVACALAGEVAPGGSVVGVDMSELMLTEARRRAGERGIHVEFVQADATALQFADDSFDGARSERMLQHLADPSAALAEMVRVVRPGGRVVALDTDWDGVVIDLDDPGLARRFRDAVCARIVSPTVGRRLYGMLVEAGLSGVEVHATPLVLTEVSIGEEFRPVDRAVGHGLEAGVLSQDDADRILAQTEEAAAAGRFFMCLPMFAAGGTVPA